MSTRVSQRSSSYVPTMPKSWSILEKKYVLLFLRENRYVEELMKAKSFLKGCIKEQKQQMEDFLNAYNSVFYEPKEILPKREVEQKI